MACSGIFDNACSPYTLSTGLKPVGNVDIQENIVIFLSLISQYRHSLPIIAIHHYRHSSSPFPFSTLACFTSCDRSSVTPTSSRRCTRFWTCTLAAAPTFTPTASLGRAQTSSETPPLSMVGTGSGGGSVYFAIDDFVLKSGVLMRCFRAAKKNIILTLYCLRFCMLKAI